jgi:hypothetical protein
VEFEVANGQAAIGGSFVGSASISEVPGEFGDGVHVAALRHTGDRLRIFMSSIMRRRSGFISAIGAISWFRML